MLVKLTNCTVVNRKQIQWIALGNQKENRFDLKIKFKGDSQERIMGRFTVDEIKSIVKKLLRK